MAFIDPEFYQGSPLQEEIENRRRRMGIGAGDQVTLTPNAPPSTPRRTTPRPTAPTPLPDPPSIEPSAPVEPTPIRTIQPERPVPNNRLGIDEFVNYQKELTNMSARATIESYFGLYGLKNLGDFVQQNIIDGISAEGMMTQLRYGRSDVPQYLEDGTRNLLYVAPEVRAVYDTRFPAMALRQENKKSRITEADYIETERGYFQIAQAAGLPINFLEASTNGQTGVTRLIGNDVSLSEWRTRVTNAEEASRFSNEPVRAILVEEYGFTPGDITAAFLDPASAISIVEARRNLGAAGLMAQSSNVLGSDQRFSRELSDALQQMDVQAREISSRISPVASLSSGIFSSEGVTGTQLGEATFGTNVDSQAEVRRERERRTRQFVGQTNMLASSEGITGVRTTST